MSKPANRLGRGLSAIIGVSSASIRHAQTATFASAPPEAPRDGDSRTIVHQVALEAIVPNPRQPRTRFDDDALRELAASIRSTGVLQPLLVRSLTNEKYELIAGERRWRAARLAGL